VRCAIHITHDATLDRKLIVPMARLSSAFEKTSQHRPTPSGHRAE
jgi:hypothetical protein